MIRVVVAEDKHPILRSLVKKIEAFSPDVRVVGQATDGIAALDAVLGLKPDVVVTDIRMPGMDGLELITKIKAALPETIFIIISGYNEFNYALQAMKLGVTEYLVKPVTRQAMDETLTKVIHMASATRHARELRRITHYVRGRSSALQSEETELTEMPYAFYEMMLICAGSFTEFAIDFASPLQAFWLEHDLPSMLAQLRSDPDGCWVLDGQAMNEMIVVWGSRDAHDFHAGPAAAELLALLEHSGVPIAIAVSARVSKPKELKLEYQVTRAILKKHAPFGLSGVLLAERHSLHVTAGDPTQPAVDEQKLAALIKHHKKEAFFAEIGSLLRLCESSRIAQSVLAETLSRIIHASHKASHVQEQLSISLLMLELEEIMAISVDYPSLQRNLSFLFEKFFSGPEGSSSSIPNIRSILEKVDRYMKSHYAEEISVHSMAEVVSVNVSYLSREFKKYKGMTPVEYLTQLRINKAKELLLDPANLMFKDIAVLVGYQNPYYFSKVFKLVTGVTPTEFKGLK